MSRFTKKVSKAFNGVRRKKDDVLNSEAVPAVGSGMVAGLLGSGGATLAGIALVTGGIATVPWGIGFPAIAAGIAIGGFGGKVFHDKQKKKKGPKPGQ